MKRAIAFQLPSKTAQNHWRNKMAKAEPAKNPMKLNYTLNGTTVTVTAHTGESNSTYTPADVVLEQTFDTGSFPETLTTGSEDITKSLAGYGLQKLLQDRTSQVTGSPKAKIEAMIAEAERLQTTGQWSALKERTSAPKGRVDSLLAQAVAELKSIPLPQAEASLKALDKEQRATIAENPAVAEVMARIKAEAKDAEAASLADLLG